MRQSMQKHALVIAIIIDLYNS